ncbi:MULTISPECIES: hypothetical protein [unclassified Microcoleus]|uniref:hypothetical protein n=1 Tax=unclassified Microcoleus TaxID=2642155 RepID=UPI002FD67FD1
MVTKTKTKKTSIGSKAAKLAQDATTNLYKGAESIAQVRQTINGVTEGASAVAGGISAVTGVMTTGKAQAKGAVVDAQQLAGASGSKTKLSEVVLSEDSYGGLTVPEVDFAGLIPTDLINPAIATTATQEQLTVGLENYAGATRAQKLYQAGFSYIAEVGKTKQLFHKAQASVIKGATEGVKVQQELVRFDRQQVELETDLVKRDQSLEKLTQEQTKLLGLQKETTQLTLKIEAVEAKRDAEIQAVQAQTQMILQKYMVESINN